VEDVNFYDSLPFARAHVRAPAYKLDTLARTMGLIDQDRGVHGALEDADILARVVCRIAEGRPDALRGWLRGVNALSPLPKGWDGGPASPARADATGKTMRTTGPVKNIITEQAPNREATPALPGEEAAEADRIAALVRAALEGSPDLPLFADRLTGAGVLVRPVLNGEMALHGIRFSTPKASFTGGVMGLTGSALGRSGIRYLHPDHADLIRNLVSAHDAVMGNILEMKDRYKAVPSGSPARPARAEARGRLQEVILREIPGTRSIFELTERLERVGVFTETRIDIKRRRVSTVLFIGEEARLPGSRVGLRTCDKGPEFWSLEQRFRSKPDDRMVGGPATPPPRAQNPTLIGDGVNKEVAELIGAINRGKIPLSPEIVAAIRCGRDAWSRMRETDLWYVLLREIPEDLLLDSIKGIKEQDHSSTLRWMCRGLNPDLSRALHLVRREMREHKMYKPEADLTPCP